MITLDEDKVIGRFYDISGAESFGTTSQILTRKQDGSFHPIDIQGKNMLQLKTKGGFNKKYIVEIWQFKWNEAMIASFATKEDQEG